MRILQLVRQFLPAQGGMESVVEGLSVALQRSGHMVQVATLRLLFSSGTLAPAESVEAGLTVRRMRHWGPRRYPVAVAALRAIRGFDLVHIHAIDFFVDYLSLLRSMHRIPLVVSTHGGYFHTARARAFKEFYFKTVTRRTLDRVGAVVCVSQHDRQMFARIVPAQRIRVIENGANLDGFSGLTKNVQPGLVLGVARLAENKRIPKVLEAMALLKDRHPHLRLEWVGADFAGLRESLEHRVAELGLSGRVCFHGAVTSEQLCSLFERAHLFVSASAYEGFGLSTVEAMSAATPVLVTAVGAHPDFVEDGVSGFLMDPEASGLAGHMERVLALPMDKLAAIGESARAATRRFCWRQVAPRYEQLYREVLIAGRRTGACLP
ncbi:MAG: glycosyltransferase family 4 protein [Acidobacteriaceae bacterium]